MAPSWPECNDPAMRVEIPRSSHLPSIRSETELTEVSVQSPGALLEELKGEAQHFFDTSRFTSSSDGQSSPRRTESFFDTVSHRNGMDSSNVPCTRLTKILPIWLEWRGLTYKVPIGWGKNKRVKIVLDSLSGQVPPGRFVACLGPTGCGKTSLINALAGRLPKGGTLEGEILVNGEPRSHSFASIAAYVMQDDVLFSYLTVEETFRFACSMRLGGVSQETRDALVNQVISELGLTKAKDTRIGNEIIRGVSGGERKRTNIGIELLSGASLIFLDEPTSGLDAFQAANVAEALWTLAGNGRTVMCTLHQPRSSIYQMFDLLLLLSEGRCIFYGPAKEAVAYFSQAGFLTPPEFNPADFFLDVISPDYRSPVDEASSQRRITLLAELYEREGYRLAAAGSVDPTAAAAFQQATARAAYPINAAAEFWLLLKRSWKQQTRDRVTQAITLGQTIVIATVLAILYSGMQNSSTPVQDETGILFFICIFSAFGAMFGALGAFPTERGVVNRERASKMYHVFPYYVARFIADIPLRVGQGLLLGAVVYWAVGLNPSAAAFFIFVSILILEGLAAQGLGISVSAACPNEKAAMAVAPAITVILVLFGGFYINEESAPVWLSWIKYISHLFYAFTGLAINNFKDRYGWKCPTGSSPGCTISGNEILNQFGFNKDELWLSFVGLAALTLGYNFLGLLLLRHSKAKYIPLAGTAVHKKNK